MQDIFKPIKKSIPINGLTYIPNFIDKLEVKNYIDCINSEKWSNELKRRVQHYGYKYDYKNRSINHSMFIGKLPNWTESLTEKFIKYNLINELPDQLIVNEYLPGQGIANHIDCEPCFTDTIISVSLGSYCIMDFINVKTKEKIEVLLEPGSVVVLSNEARYDWTHGITPRKSDKFKGFKMIRDLRISMTFRKVNLNEK